MVAVTFQDTNVRIRGQMLNMARRFFNYSGKPVVWEIMVEGPRGTGKSRQTMQVLAALAEVFPGSRGLLVRNKRRSMSGTTLVEWEKCFPPGHPALEGPKPEGRSVYRIGDSHVYVAGLDEADRLRSFTLDWVYYEEGTESTSSEEWESLYGALRSWKMPFQILITTVNPKQPGHWLNKRAKEGRIERLCSVFQDNPVLYDEERACFTPEGEAFVAQLKKLTGHRYRRDFLGEWSASEGVVFDEYDENVHLIDATVDRRHSDHAIVVPAWNARIPIDWYGISMDFGYRAPGVLQVWGVNDDSKRTFRVAEVYQPGKQLDWWADAIVSLRQEFPFDVGVADSAEPRTIDFLNDRSRSFMRRDGPFIRKADKANGKLWGLDQLRWGFSAINNGPRTYLLKNAHRFGLCEDLATAGKPLCLEDEIPNYLWRMSEGKRSMEYDEPDPSCADHAIDAAVYFHVFAWKRLEAKRRAETIFKPGTMGEWLGDYETLGWGWRRNA